MLRLLVLLLYLSAGISSVLLKHCFFPGISRLRETEPCEANNTVEGEDGTLLPLLDLSTKKELYRTWLNLTCSSTRAIQWVVDTTIKTNVKTGGDVLGNQKVLLLPSNSGSYQLTYILEAYIELYEFNGIMRCKAIDDIATQALVISTAKASSFIAHLLSPNYFIASNQSNVTRVPCKLSGPDLLNGSNSVNLYKVARERKISEACLGCLGYPWENSSLSCNGEDRTRCGYFRISEFDWMTAGKELPLDLTVVQTDDDGWRACVQDYDCAVRTLDALLSSKRRDCNEDGVISCDDYVLIHRYGTGKCPIVLDGGEEYLQHSWCLRKLDTGEDITRLATYNPSEGFVLNGSVDESSMYVCALKSRIELVAYVPLLDPRDRFPTHVSLTTSEDGRTVRAVCVVKIPGKGLKYMYPDTVACPTRYECDLELRPFSMINFPFPFKLKWQSKLRAMGILSSSEGLIRCSGVKDQNDRTVYVSHYDYFFTGLDFKMYLATDNVPRSALLQLVALPDPVGVQFNHNQTIACRSSAFMARPIFQFAVQYSNGSSWLAPSNVYGGNFDGTPVEGNFSRIQSTDRVLEQLFVFKMTPDIEAAICMVPLTNGTMWISQTLPLSSSAKASRQWIAAWITATISFVLVLALIVAIAIIIFLHRRVHKLTKEEVKEILEGTGGEPLQEVNDGNQPQVVDVDTISLPQAYRLPSDVLKIDWDKVLGEGEYGRCFRGTLTCEGQAQTVAVKMLKDATDKEMFKNFIGEAKIMAYVGDHVNVVKFIGAMVDRIAERICHVVIEYSPHGNLREYLAAHSVAIEKNPSLTYTSRSGYSSVRLNQLHLASFCAQVAAGMEHVSSMKVIHADLAARNCLVFPNNVVKITDFGLARRLYSSVKYTKKSEVPLPWRWMAPESIKFLEFSTSSDMWSFGITVWEVFTCGQVPFSWLNTSDQLVSYVEEGQSLAKPEYASKDIYEFLRKCWSRKKEDRPNFPEATVFFQRITSDRGRTDCPNGQDLVAETRL